MTRIVRETLRTGRKVALIALVAWGAAGIAAASENAIKAPSEDELKEPALTRASERGEITIDGDLADGTARRLRIMLRSDPAIRTLVLESDGGLVDEAEQIGDIVAAHGLVTVVRTLCVSACTLAYVRGRERFAQEGARLGFHAPWVPAEGGGETEVSSDDERQAYLSAGVAADFVAEALAVPATSVWFPDEARLLRANVVTAVLKPAELADRVATLARPRLAAVTAE